MVRDYSRHQRSLTANAARAHSSNIAGFFRGASNQQANRAANTTDTSDTIETGRDHVDVGVNQNDHSIHEAEEDVSNINIIE